MYMKTRTSLISSVIIAVLVFSAFGTTIAYADGETTDTTPGSCDSVPADLRTATNGCGSGDKSDQPASDGSTEAAAPAPSEKSAPAEPAPDLGTVPDNTTVTVLDADGQSQPLATLDAADALAQSDPIWCPAGQSPTPGANGCTQTFTSFTDLLNFLSGNTAFSGDGTIYVQQGAYNGGESSIDFNSGSFDLSNIHNNNLTITGGWNTSTNAVDNATTSDFNIPILVGASGNPWGGTLTISNISITGTTGTGLTVYTTGDINLTNVTVTGAVATSGNENGSGAVLDADGNVTIDHSKFSGNRTSGATITSRSSVAISNSDFSNPPLSQALHGRSQIDGLDIVNDGDVSLFNVLANGNRWVGSNITSGGRVTIVQSEFSGTKSINGTFHGYGLQVVTPGIIDLDTVTASDNFLWGAKLNAGSDVNIANSIFNANSTESPGFIDDTGLLVTSGGNVSINGSHADDNRLLGATIDATGDVSINNSTFSNNNGVTVVNGANQYDGIGLQVTNAANIFINMVTASNNTVAGGQLNSAGDVTISASDFSGQTSASPTPLGRGLEVTSGGSVFLDNVTLNNNQTFGANIQATGDVFMEAVTATGNGGNGVTLQAACVHVVGGTFTNNGGYGLDLGSSALDMTIAPAFGGNTLGDMNPQTPVTCAPVLPIVVPAPPSTTGTGVVSVVSNAATSAGSDSVVNVSGKTVSGGTSYATMTLNSYLASAKTGSAYGLFIGKYAYVDTLAGLQIFALVPDSRYLAMR